MMAYGGMAKDVVWVPYATIMEMCSKEHGGMILCMGRYDSSIWAASFNPSGCKSSAFHHGRHSSQIEHNDLN